MPVVYFEQTLIFFSEDIRNRKKIEANKIKENINFRLKLKLSLRCGKNVVKNSLSDIRYFEE